LTEDESTQDRLEEAAPKPFRVSLPRFITGDEAVGLGDVIKRATSIAGIRPCIGCEHRAAKLNRYVVFSAGPRK